MRLSRILLLVALGVSLLGATGQLYTGSTQLERPECQSARRGRMWTEQSDTSAADTAYLCARVDGAYTWFILPMVTATATPIDVAAITDGTCDATNTLAWDGVVLGQPISVGLDSASGLTVTAYATSADLIVLNVCNGTGSDQDPRETTYNFERRAR